MPIDLVPNWRRISLKIGGWEIYLSSYLGTSWSVNRSWKDCLQKCNSVCVNSSWNYCLKKDFNRNSCGISIRSKGWEIIRDVVVIKEHWESKASLKRDLSIWNIKNES